MKKKVFRITAIVLGILVAAVAGGVTYLKTALPDVGAAPELQVAMSADQIERGKYLANHVALCVDCHSQRDFTQFAGPIKAGTFGGGGEKFGPEMGFPGSFYSPNLTPAALKDWTDGEIYRAVTAGVSRDGRPLFPVMGYHNFGQMDDRDIHAIIAYVRTIPPVQNVVPKSEADFPFSLILHTIPHKGIPQTRPDEKEVLAYGKYLTTFAGCADCHTQQEQGKPVPGMDFAGGFEFKMPMGTVRSANITPDTKTGIGNWTQEAFVSRFKMYADSAYQAQVLGKDDFNTVMPWRMYAGMKESDLKAIFTYLKSLQPVENSVVRFDPTTPQNQITHNN